MSVRDAALANAMQEVDLYLESPGKLLTEFVKLTLALLDSPAKLCRIEGGPATVRAGLTMLRKPSDVFLDLVTAARTSKLKRLVGK